MFQRIFVIAVLFAFSQPSHAYRLFQSHYPAVHSAIEKCRVEWPDEKPCDNMLSCVLDNVPGDYPARWSAVASMLAFIPTIVGLMSNSVIEVTAIAEESTFLAIAVSLSSVTTFSSRLGNEITAVKLGYQDVSPAYLEAARANIINLIKDNTQKHSREWWNARMQNAFVGTFLIGASTLI